MLEPGDERLAEALVDLQELTKRLRRDCPWDREQTARTIVPHTVEEAYEVADAAYADDPEKLLDELSTEDRQRVRLRRQLPRRREHNGSTAPSIASSRSMETTPSRPQI